MIELEVSKDRNTNFVNDLKNISDSYVYSFKPGGFYDEEKNLEFGYRLNFLIIYPNHLFARM